MEESAVHSSVENSCNLVGVYGAVREQGCQERVLAPHEERNGKVNVRKRKGQRSTHEGCWRLMPSTKQIHTKLQPILSKKTKPYALYSDPMPHSVIPCPGKSHRLLLPLDGSVRWRVALCSAVGGIDRTASSNSALINHVRF